MSRQSKDFVIQKELGRGSFGVVFLAQQVSTRNLVVLKQISIGHLALKYQQQALREVEILKGLSHPNIIKYFSSYIEDNTLSIITEYAEGGDLSQLLTRHRRRKVHMSENEIWRILRELSSALGYLHSKNVIHRDIKCQNVFLTRNYIVKLGDLGASKLMTANMQITRVGTPLYLAPEMIKQQPYDYKIDIWGLGCILYMLTSHDSPFVGSNLITLGLSIINRNPKPIPSMYSKRLNQLILKLLEKNPSQRLDIGQVLIIASSNSENIEELATNFTVNGTEEEISSKRIERVARPKPLPNVICENIPYKPIFRQSESVKTSFLSSAHVTEKNAQEKPKKTLRKYKSRQEIIMETPKNPWTTEEPRPKSTRTEEKIVSVSRPSTAKPSMRTIIRSNTVVKINNFFAPIKDSKVKLTINDLLFH